MFKYRNIIFFLFIFCSLAWSSCRQNPDTNDDQNQGKTKVTYDVIVDTDLGGDPDDIQSLFRLIHYSDILRIKGIVSTPCTQIESHPWDTIPRKRLISEWIRRIDVDHLRQKGYKELMREEELLALIRDGSQIPGPPSDSGATEGSRWIISQAGKYSADDPLWILVWGSATTLAQAFYDAPGIASNIRIYSIGSSNTQHDSLSRNFIYEFLEKGFPDLWWIENGILPKWKHETFRGVYLGGEQKGEWANTGFIKANIRGHGSTHQGMFSEKCGDVFPVANWPDQTLKEGDSPSMLYLLSPVLAGVGNVDDPTTQGWGGQFRLADASRFPNYYVDLDQPPERCQETINKWRKDFLTDWKERWDRYDEL